MAKLISSVDGLVGRINEYQQQAAKLAEVIPYNRAWYAMREWKNWVFGPSKFVGYCDLGAKEYLDGARKGNLDGRVTEAVLQKWSELVQEGHPQFDELHTSLREFCARFGKKPNTLARIAVVLTKEAASSSGPLFPDELVVFMVAVYRKLTPAQKAAFQKEAI